MPYHADPRVVADTRRTGDGRPANPSWLHHCPAKSGSWSRVTGVLVAAGLVRCEDCDRTVNIVSWQPERERGLNNARRQA